MCWKQQRQRFVSDLEPPPLPPTIKLPVLPTVALEFNRMSEDPACGPRELGKLIESDTGLMYELLKYANSSAFAARVKSVTAQQAISRLGIRAVKLFLLSTAVQQAMRNTQSKLINIENFWVSNLERALFAREVARLLNTDADIAYAASLLHDFLLPAIGNELYRDYTRYIETPEKSRMPLVEFERAAFGWDHAQMTAHVLYAWEFPDELIVCARLHHHGLNVLNDEELGTTPVAAVAVAGLIPDPLRQSGDGLLKLKQLSDIWPELHLPVLAERVAGQLASITPLARQHFSLQRRVEKMEALAIRQETATA